MDAKQKVRKQLVKYSTVLLGAVIYAVGFQFFMYPNSIVAGGVVGIAMIINRLSGLPVGVLTIIMNIPLFLIAWRHFGLDFLIGSLVGMALSSVCVDLFATTDFVATMDPLLGSIIGGVIKGFGLGIIYYVGATTGGVDIVAKFLRRRFAQINFGTIVLLMDVVIIFAYAIILEKYDSAMYSMIGMFVVSKVIDLVLYGIDNSNICYIISENSEEIIKEIISGHVRRGVTILEGEGAYSHRKKDIIMCVIKRTQIGEIRNLVKTIDENAFFIVVDAKNVFGNGFENIAEVR
ncbi:MAG: YitT family protein [Oscillospiraceae bacterium]|nr:YitT family protein [Oscillospiraceae bacterium]